MICTFFVFRLWRTSVVVELERALEFLRLFLLGLRTLRVGEALVDLLEVFVLVVKIFEVKLAVDIPHAVVGNRVAHAVALDFGAAVPFVG